MTMNTARRWPVARLAAALTTIALTAAAVYVFAQYRAAQQPASLSSLPQYPFRNTSSAAELTAQERGRAETTMRDFASRIKPNYQPSAELIRTHTGDFIWDAVRAYTGSYLSRAGFHVESDGQASESPGDPAYILWSRTNPVQKLFDNTTILAVGMQTPANPAPPAGQLHLYAYFALKPRS